MRAVMYKKYSENIVYIHFNNNDDDDDGGDDDDSFTMCKGITIPLKSKANRKVNRLTYGL